MGLEREREAVRDLERKTGTFPVPNFPHLCLPLQSRQMSVPIETLAQSGFGVEQSAHTPFPGMEVIRARSPGDICILPVYL